MLYDFLEPLGVSQADFAQRIDVTPARLNEIIKGKRTVTPLAGRRDAIVRVDYSGADTARLKEFEIPS